MKILVIIMLFSFTLQSKVRYEIPCNKLLFESSIDSMKSQVGVTEDKVNNTGKKVNEYQKVGGGLSGQAWCMYFQYWCFYVAYQSLIECYNIEIPITKSGSSQQPYKDALKYGKRTDYKAKVGDLIIWNYPNGWAGHIERIVKVGESGWVLTIGGNVGNTNSNDGDCVAYKKRNVLTKLGRMRLRAVVGFNTEVK